MSTTLLSAFYDIDFLCKVGRSALPQARPGLPAPRRCRRWRDGAAGRSGRGTDPGGGGRDGALRLALRAGRRLTAWPG